MKIHHATFDLRPSAGERVCVVVGKMVWWWAIALALYVAGQVISV